MDFARPRPRSIAVGATGTTLIEEVRFALDSPLEGDEFELMVPGLRDRQTLMGDGTAVVKTAADLSGNRRFESV